MSNSLLEQLKKVGLVDDKQIRQAKQDRQKQQKGHTGQAAPTHEAKQLAQRAQAEKIERDRQLNQQRQEEEARKAIAAQIKQLIESNRIENRDGEIAYNFTDGKKIKRIHVNGSVHKELCKGQLAIAKLGNRYELVPSDIADKIRERDASCVIARTSNEATTTTENDPYAAYTVPDDLMW